MVRETDPDDGFLSRWSRRKREVEAEAKAAEAKAAMVQAAEVQARARTEIPGLPADTAPDIAETDPVTVDPEAEPAPEMIEPPSLDIIDKDFDLAHWLKQNVPESWKLAALRRTWETDPFIHGYLNPAREYALDWNTPGGAPGYGPLTESDDVKAMITRIFGDVSPEKDTPADLAEAQPDADDPETLRLSDNTGLTDAGIAASQQNAPEAVNIDDNAAAPSLNAVRLSETAPAVVPAAHVAMQHNPAPEPLGNPVISRVRRRGGGAIPV